MVDKGKFTGEFFIPGASGDRIEADHLERYRFAQRFVSGKRVLDLACGSGYGSRLLREAGAAEVVGVDISFDALELACQNNMPGLRFEQGDATTWTDGETYDVVISFETIEHVTEPDTVLKNLRRLVRPDGILIVSSPNRPVTSPSAATMYDRPSNEFHVREFTPAELAQMCRNAGFDVDRRVYGQRCQPRLPSIGRRTWTRFRRPAVRASPKPRPLRPWQTSRYFVLTGVPKKG